MAKLARAPAIVTGEPGQTRPDNSLHGIPRMRGRMAELADATALGAVGATLGGSNPLPPISLG